MSEEKAFCIQMIREKILSNIPEEKELFSLSLLNREWYVDVRKRLESKSTSSGWICNQKIVKYTDKIKEPIICGRYMKLSYIIRRQAGKFTKKIRAKVIKRLPLLEPRIFEVELAIRKSITAKEVITVLKTSRNASSVYWAVDIFENEEELRKLFHEVKVLLEAENVSFVSTKTLILNGKSKIEFKFWAEEFMQYFPKLENLEVQNWLYGYSVTSEFLKTIDESGKLQTLCGFSCDHLDLEEEFLKRFLEKSYNFTKLEFYVLKTNFSVLELILAKYQNQIENLRLHLIHGPNELHIPAMSKLKKLDIWCARFSGYLTFDEERISISEDEDAYPNLRELKIGGSEIEKLIFHFRNFSKNSGLCLRIKTVTAEYAIALREYCYWEISGGESEILEELNQLFPNAENKMYYDQKKYLGYTDLPPQRRRCVIS